MFTPDNRLAVICHNRLLFGQSSTTILPVNVLPDQIDVYKKQYKHNAVLKVVSVFCAFFMIYVFGVWHVYWVGFEVYQ